LPFRFSKPLLIQVAPDPRRHWLTPPVPRRPLHTSMRE
jgi:hypothetical protein